VEPGLLELAGKNSYHSGMTSIVSEKGQVTIPKTVRDDLGLEPGTVVDFKVVNGKLVGSKKVGQDVFAKWRGRGKLPGKMSVDQYLRRTRDADSG
jgi:AbrB family looped-hinge helix DNA binding protein